MDKIYNKTDRKKIRENRLEEFKNKFLETVKSKSKLMTINNKKYTFVFDNNLIVDFFPHRDRLLIRNENRWYDDGLQILLNLK